MLRRLELFVKTLRRVVENRSQLSAGALSMVLFFRPESLEQIPFFGALRKLSPSLRSHRIHARRKHLTINTVLHTVCITYYMANGTAGSPEILENLKMELRRGCLIVAVLAQLRTEQYGYTLRKALADDGLAIDEGTLYPLLRRLETQGLLVSQWRE
jgi:hypothetical protein